MDGQPAFLILVLAIVALMQVQGHRPIVQLMPVGTAEPTTEVSRCNGIELEIGCALVEMWSVAPIVRD